MSLEILNSVYQSENTKIPSTHRMGYWLQAAAPSLKSFFSNEQSGKWCMWINPAEVDTAWEKVKSACEKGDLMLAKCSTALSSGTKQYPNFLICVYTLDWEDEEDLQKVRNVLKELGFTQPLKYKRDLETMNEVYGTDKEFYIIETE